MKFRLFIIFFLSIKLGQGQEIQKSTFSFTVNELANSIHFVSGQNCQSVVNNKIFLGFLPLNFSFLNVDLINDTAVNLYPNPFDGILFLEIEPLNTIVNIYNSNSELVFMTRPSKSLTHLNLKHLPKGFYLISIQNANYSIVKKIIKT